MSDSLLTMLREDYQIDITDADYKRLTDTLNMYQVSPQSIRIDLQSDIANFVNNIHLMKSIKFQRLHTEIEMEDVIYQMKPMLFGCYEEINTAYPSHFHTSINHDVPDINEPVHENIVLIRTMKYSSRDAIPFLEKYTLMIYNKELDVRAGIRFEQF